ncbi:helix-turn-helix domain-containing protein [Iningainema tapete]|uniref:Helix-turn-helix domain-containing protein n=1 Tax=Iningainema tapete BLCC-T55 TaxID=2748662 RepID=A0A8J6XMM2_9CYAN|nr:helix-turn-helix transcriptional regulator [Iningainema tapete]MBD2776007.1 helix-turn-helix domain-containing protein [Iningainema tapete BLCC-T55]
MIKDELEYQVSQEWVEKFKKSIAVMEKDEERKRNDPERWELNRSALQCHLDKLQEEIAEYERLINCDNSQQINIKVESLHKLPDALIKARIAAKMSRKELADILGIEEQRVQEYEKTDYQCASFVEILEVSAALGIEFETATVQVDFEEIEAGKQSAEKWRKWRSEKMNVKTKVS